jgi:hypothetical protein
VVRRGVIAAIVVLGVMPAAPARAETVSGPREVVSSEFTTTQPGAPTGMHYVGRYHAANDPEGEPPYMRRMSSRTRGLRYDTTVPERCTASDAELALRGPDACPPGSRIGGGTADGRFLGQDNTLPVHAFNNAGEQVYVISSPFFATVARGQIADDGTVTFASPTCYPALAGACPVDTALQLGSDIAFPPYTRDGRSYMTTPPSCPGSGAWRTPITFWWADGAEDTVVTRQPCAPTR